MKKLLLFTAIPSLLFMLASCGPNVRGHGDIKTDTRNVNSFSRISVSAPLNVKVHVKDGSTPSVALHGYENILKVIQTEIRDNTLFITLEKSKRIETDKELVADVTLPALEEFSVAGAGDAEIDGRVTGKSFTLDISGAGNVTAENISVSDMEAHISGAGNFEAGGGSADHVSYTVTGTGNIDAYPLQAKEVEASVSGAGNIELTATEKLKASISGVGNVSYKGHPASLQSHKSGVGSFDDAN
ncbi:head GIN domain-containing protein [Chitinophagaceae bacterium MMS25-I14]